MKRLFLDTNVIAYVFDDSDPRKQKIAKHLFATHSAQLVISTQVLIELHSVCSSKLGMSSSEVARVVEIAAGLNVVPADRNLILDAVALAEREGLSIFDAAILRAAERAECDQIVTEDAKFAHASGPIDVFDPFAA